MQEGIKTFYRRIIMTMTKPTAFNQVIGNVAAIERIKTEIADNNGLAGCVFFLQGESGTGKNTIADILVDIAIRE